VFAAAGLGDRVKAAAAIFPAASKPPAQEPAATLKIPGLVFAAPGDSANIRFNAVELARAWPGSLLRGVNKSEATGLAEGRRMWKFIGLGGTHRRTQKTIRPLLTGFLLYTLTSDKKYEEFADPDVQQPKTTQLDPGDDEPVTTEEQIAALLRR
jgi:hypothetical protein